MSDDQGERIRQLETENARLRGLLDRQGGSSTLRHQVRNALGLMRAILRRSAEGKASVADFAAHVEGRFDALLRVQTAVLSQPDGHVDLAGLVSDELLAQTIEEGRQATITGPSARLESRQAMLFGLAIHELATNALKFGTLTMGKGHIDVSWRISATQQLTFIWAESGRKRDEPTSSFRGFGIEAIEGILPYQLRAESKLEFLSEGLRCTLILPLHPQEGGAGSSP